MGTRRFAVIGTTVVAALLAPILVISPPVQPADPGAAFVPIAPLPSRTIDGWATTVRGLAFDYHSAHPSLGRSLLVRSLDSTAGAAWRSEPAPAGSGDLRLAMLVALDVVDPGQEPVTFHLTIGGRHRLLIPQPMDTGPWTITDSSGASLAFRPFMVDKFGDVHGRLVLTVPAAWVRPGRPAECAVHGQSANRMSWFILYLTGMRPSVAVVPEQALLRTPRGPRRSIRLDVWNPWEPLHLATTLGDRPASDTVLGVGGSALRMAAEPVSAPASVRLTLRANDHPAVRVNLRLDPVIPRDFHLINHAHLDIGYTRYQEEVLERTWAGYDSAIALAERTRGYPDEARFRWNVEGLWPLEELLRRDSVRAERVLAAVARGDLVLNANYANLMMGLSSSRTLEMMLATAGRLRATHGVSITTAMTSDVPGAPAAVIPVLAAAGVRWLSMGPNYQPSLPMQGDRIGHTIARLGDRPFWWRSLGGRDSVLVMMAGRGYSWMHRFPAGRITLEEAGFITEYAATLTRERNPYRIVQLRIAYGGDNGMPDARLPDVVKQWNETFVSPRLVISTLPRLFQAFERQYGPTVPRLRGDFTGYWEDGAMSTAREEVLVRRAAARLELAESTARARGVGLDERGHWRAWKEVVLWDEHTWGADRSITEPDAPDVVAQWTWKAARARAADSLSRQLLATSRSQPSHSPERAWQGPPEASPVWVTGDSLGNGVVTVKLNRGTGAIASLRWRGQELADARRGGIGSYRYVRGRDTSTAAHAVVRQITVGPASPDSGRLEILSDGAGVAGLIETITVRRGRPEVEISLTVDKVPVREKEAVHFSFAFALPAATVRFDPAGTIVRADLDQLAAANRNVVSAGSMVDASNARAGVTIATPDAPLWQVGGLTAEAFKRDDGTESWLERTLPGSVLVAYLMNNYWHTNFKADQSGPVTFRFVVQPHDAFDATRAARFGASVRLDGPP